MIAQAITRVSLPSFRERSAGKKIVLLYPWTNYRNLFLTHFLSSAKEGLLYYRIPAETTNMRDWLRGLVDEFDSVLNGFGDNLRAVIDDGAPDQLGEALERARAANATGTPYVIDVPVDQSDKHAEFIAFHELR